ncbi:MAG: SWIM zinc finger domain-containing protein [Anaerolineae bacterium]|nr:SWIM zinc finger domain-containing protein [Anaerolineae bacterium]
MKPKNIKRLQARAHRLHAQVIDRHTIVVQSTTGSTANHVVTIYYDNEGSIHARCTCAWAINGGVACSHVIAALETLAARRGRALSFWLSERDARRQKRRVLYLDSGRENNRVWITSRAA